MSTLTVGTISEKVVGEGISVDGVRLKDGELGTTASPVAIHSSSLNGGQFGGRRNIVINGAMQISQRGTSFSVSDNIYTLDRFVTEFSGLGAFTLTQSTDAPDGFGNSLKLDCTTADASPASGDIFQLFHKIEGQNLQQLKKGTSDAEKVTLSFFVKSNKTGNMQVNLRDANSRIIGATYAISSANTWERKTITFDGDTSGSIANDNTAELTIEFPVGSGSNYTSGAVPTAWEASSDADRNAGSNINIADNTANEWYLTGVQLEVGSQATPFEHRSFGEELALCQRYALMIKNGTTSINRFGLGSTVSATTVQMLLQHPVRMRSAPTLTTTGTASDYQVYSVSVTTCSVAPSLGEGSQFNGRYNFVVSSGLTGGQIAQCIGANTNAFLLLSSEL